MPVPILVYHQIATAPARSLVVHPRRFRSQMLWLKRIGYRGLSVRDALPYLRGERQGKVAVVTFDDGFLNVLENAAPALAECGFTATNYFVSNQIGGSNIWDKPSGQPRAPCMSLTQLREWAALGHEVGAHTMDHVDLTRTPDDEARRQIAGSKAALEDMVGQAVTSFCYPHGANAPIHREMAREAGFETATTTVRARARPGDDPFGIPRIYVRWRHAWPEFLLRCFSR